MDSSLEVSGLPIPIKARTDLVIPYLSLCLARGVVHLFETCRRFLPPLLHSWR